MDDVLTESRYLFRGHSFAAIPPMPNAGEMPLNGLGQRQFDRQSRGQAKLSPKACHVLYRPELSFLDTKLVLSPVA